VEQRITRRLTLPAFHLRPFFDQIVSIPKNLHTKIAQPPVFPDDRKTAAQPGA
jgi:hypothetical protein